MTTVRTIAGVAVRTWWTLVLAVAVSSAGTWAAVDHANANQRRAQERSNQQFRQTQILANRKFQQAISIASAQASYSINKSVCGFRGFVGPTLRSYEAAAKDPTLTPSARARNNKRIQSTRAFLSTQVTVPSSFDCSQLPSKPPKGAP